MGILFKEIYSKAIGLFDDPKITMAFKTNEIQFEKLMYVYLQTAISMFNNPACVGARLASYEQPKGTLQVIDADGENNTYDLDEEFIIIPDSVYSFTEGELTVSGIVDIENHTVTFPDVLPAGKQYSIEQYFCGKFLDDFAGFNRNADYQTSFIQEQIKGILARLLVKSWAENERNELLDIRNMLQDSDFKLSSNAATLRSKNEWLNQLDFEITQIQNRLAWAIRFGNSSSYIGRG